MGLYRIRTYRADSLADVVNAPQDARILIRGTRTEYLYNPLTSAWENMHPAGAIIAFGGSLAPAGWLMCDGSAISRITYDHLFTAISTAFGVGDNSTTFNVPDLRQKFPLGKAASGTGSTLGVSGGTIDHLHTADPPATTSGGPSATVNAVTIAGLTAVGSNVHTHDTNIASFNTGTANPPFVAVNFIIKT